MAFLNFRALGRSGLVVSQFALGTMTFGAGVASLITSAR